MERDNDNNVHHSAFFFSFISLHLATQEAKK